ncbi:ethanolamine ammonia-lyase subunit EutC [Paraflavitalea soli]|uniref:Ethanolamine ammonia-lyase small subunit n=1 Tax=Paraflavitalea soli TaxID=2315862 RepID=A0A3B7MJC7_9BACT|nr:ethanolamine ammonia-lyase subunit EutC [Paraflavitalea soli]AXY74532.1 ethanolamine ammonia-lyase subunit EutC [Paraflavitalea soli]
MNDNNIQHSIIQPDPWASLRAFTPARIALGRTGTAIPLQEVLQFRMAHAHARDAVHSLLETETLLSQLQAFSLPVHLLHSQASDRHEYLQRPDKGRRLNEASAGLLSSPGDNGTQEGIAIILADGLSAKAVNSNAVPLLDVLLPLLRQASIELTSLSLVQQGRVAIGDEIGQLLNATLTVVLIGERPGLSSPDSLGIYLTYHPQVGLTDEARNCISNVRPGGLSYQAAADKLFWLIQEALRLQLSGVELKDDAGSLLTEPSSGNGDLE